MFVTKAARTERAKRQRVVDKQKAVEQAKAVTTIQSLIRGMMTRRKWGMKISSWCKVQHVGHDAFQRLQENFLEPNETATIHFALMSDCPGSLLMFDYFLRPRFTLS